MKKTILVLMISMPFLMAAQEKGIPDRNNSKGNNNSSILMNTGYEFASLTRIHKDNSFSFEAMVLSDNEKGYEKIVFEDMLEALNGLGAMGFEMKGSEQYTIRDYDYHIFYFQKPLSKTRSLK